MFGTNFGNNASSGGVSYTPEAIAYIAAAGITDTTEKDAVNQLVLDLKGTGSTTNNTDVWIDSYAVYPLSPTSLSAAAFNLKQPTQNITWFNSPIHSINGVRGNGTNMYGETSFNPTTYSVDTNNSGLTYSGEYSVGDYAVGALESSRFMALRTTTGLRIGYSGTSGSSVSFASTARLVTTSSRTGEFLYELYNNGVLADSNSTSSAGSQSPNTNIYILAISNSGVLTAPFAAEMDFVAAHKGLSANQAQDLYDSITTYNTAVR